MDLRHIDTSAVTDVSTELGEANPANRLYRLESGQIVKVKTFELPRVAPMAANCRVFRLTTSLCDEAGVAIMAPSADDTCTAYLKPGGPSIAAQLEDRRLRLAVWAETALQLMTEDIPGVAPLPPPEPEPEPAPEEPAPSEG